MKRAVNPVTSHLFAFSSLLAHDQRTKALHIRDLQVIATVACAPEPVSVSTVAARLKLSRSHLSRIANRLVEGGLLARAPQTDDRRLALLIATKAGRELDNHVRNHFDTAAPADAKSLPSLAAAG